MTLIGYRLQTCRWLGHLAAVLPGLVSDIDRATWTPKNTRTGEPKWISGSSYQSPTTAG